MGDEQRTWKDLPPDVLAESLWRARDFWVTVGAILLIPALMALALHLL